MSPGDSSLLFRALPTALRLAPSERKQIREFVARVARELAGSRHFNCLITSDEELRNLNRSFLGHDYATDVLSFPALPGSAALGEIAISVERAEAQANEFGHTRLQETQILLLHGLLHLIGLDHESDSGEMARAEEHWRRHFQLPVALISRTAAAAEVRQ